MQNVDKLEPVNNAAKPDINKVKPDINKVKPVPAVSIIVPVFNEAAQLDRLIAAANSWKADDLVFVDGGSDDAHLIDIYTNDSTSQGNNPRIVITLN